jgi:hypothetical protein
MSEILNYADYVLISEDGSHLLADPPNEEEESISVPESRESGGRSRTTRNRGRRRRSDGSRKGIRRIVVRRNKQDQSQELIEN